MADTENEELPSDPGWYADSGGFLWAFDPDFEPAWKMYSESVTQPHELPNFSLAGFAPFTRMLPVAEVEGMLGEGLASRPLTPDVAALIAALERKAGFFKRFNDDGSNETELLLLRAAAALRVSVPETRGD